jgi:hypothetical protein
MPCVVGCLALSAPRIALFLVWLFSDYVGEAYRSNLVPFLGFLFLPLTTLAYAFAWHQGGGSVGGPWIALVVVAVFFDLGLIGSGERARRQKTKAVVIKGERVG